MTDYRGEFLRRYQLSVPIVQAPMAGAQDERMAVAVSRAGGLGSIACALLSSDEVISRVGRFRSNGGKALNLNFFCHAVGERDVGREKRWRAALERYFRQYDLPADYALTRSIHSFGAEMCDIVCSLKPTVVSFHFGLPDRTYVDRIRAAGSGVFSTATTPREAKVLAVAGCDAIILQGLEAGGHQGSFLDRTDFPTFTTSSLLCECSQTLHTPLIAAGGIMTGADVASVVNAGAAAAQLGTRFLKTPESTISDRHRAILEGKDDRPTEFTNLFTGRPARSLVNRFMQEMGPIHPDVQEFPLAMSAIAPIKAATRGSEDFIPLWAGREWRRGKPRTSAQVMAELTTDFELCLNTVAT